jgi:UDP-glucuronate 4-epimerase
MKKYILVTGSAGFIGSHLVRALLNKKHHVIGIDNLDDYYDINLKKHRLKEIKQLNLKQKNDYIFFKIDIKSQPRLQKLFRNYKIKSVYNLAAQAGVISSTKYPIKFSEDNILGFINLIDVSKYYKIDHFIYASSSSVYGHNLKSRMKEDNNTDRPKSIYGASKKTNELIAFTFSQTYKMPTTGLRFFTVYGPNGRPDMAYYKFAKAIFEKKPISIYNFGKLYRDFIYIDDVVEYLLALLKKPPKKDLDYFRILNVGSGDKTSIKTFISIIEEACGIRAIKNYNSLPTGDVVATFADTKKLQKLKKIKAKVSLRDGIRMFIDWYRNYHNN